MKSMDANTDSNTTGDSHYSFFAIKEGTISNPNNSGKTSEKPSNTGYELQEALDKLLS